MSTSNIRQRVAYGLTDALLDVFPSPIIANRVPTTNDKAQLGQIWVDNLNNEVFILSSIVSNVATWSSITGLGTITTITTDAGNAVPLAGVLDIAGGSNINTSGAGNTVTINLDTTISVAGSITAGTGITSTTGNIVATAGQVNAGTTMTAGTGITSTTGNIVATAGSVQAGTTLVAGTGLTISAFGAGVMQTSAGGVASSTNGTNGQVLVGGGAAPAWANITAGANITVTNGANTITIAANTGASTINYTLVNTSPYVVAATDDYLGVDCSGGAIQVNLPNAPATGRIFIIKDKTGSAATHTITVTTVGGAVTIDGATSKTITTNYTSFEVIFNGTSYEVF